MAKKSAVKSLGFWGSTASLVSWFYMIVEIVSKIPPELIEDTKSFVLVTLAGVFASLMSLIGRWRAQLPLSLIGSKK